MLKKILLSCTIAGTAMVSGIVTAAAESHSAASTTVTSDSPYELMFNIATGGLYNGGFSWSSLIDVMAGRGIVPTISWALYNSSDEIVDSHSIAYNGTTALGGNWAIDPINLAAGTYYIDFVASHLTATDVTYSLNSVAVPGPIVGAGLPALLGMMGFAAWRRRKSAPTAV